MRLHHLRTHRWGIFYLNRSHYHSDGSPRKRRATQYHLRILNYPDLGRLVRSASRLTRAPRISVTARRYEHLGDHPGGPTSRDPRRSRGTGHRSSNSKNRKPIHPVVFASDSVHGGAGHHPISGGWLRGVLAPNYHERAVPHCSYVVNEPGTNKSSVLRRYQNDSNLRSLYHIMCYLQFQKSVVVFRPNYVPLLQRRRGEVTHRKVGPMRPRKHLVRAQMLLLRGADQRSGRRHVVLS